MYAYLVCGPAGLWAIPIKSHFMKELRHAVRYEKAWFLHWVHTGKELPLPVDE